MPDENWLVISWKEWRWRQPEREKLLEGRSCTGLYRITVPFHWNSDIWCDAENSDLDFYFVSVKILNFLLCSNVWIYYKPLAVSMGHKQKTRHLFLDALPPACPHETAREEVVWEAHTVGDGKCMQIFRELNIAKFWYYEDHKLIRSQNFDHKILSP